MLVQIAWCWFVVQLRGYKSGTYPLSEDIQFWGCVNLQPSPNKILIDKNIELY